MSRRGTLRWAESKAWRIPAAVLAAGLAVTAVAVWATRVNTRDVRDLEFDALAKDARTAIERRIAATTEVLFGLRSLLTTEIGRAEFHEAVAIGGVRVRHRGVRAVSFNRRVRPSERAAFEQRVRLDTSLVPTGYPGFRVHPPSSGRDMVVVDYIEPLQGNEAAFGLDVASDPTRRATVDEARDTGEVAASAPLDLVQNEGRRRGFLMFLATYESPGVPATAPARRRRFDGAVVIAYETRSLLVGVLGADSRVQIEEIYDVGPTVESQPRLVAAAGRLIDVGPAVSALHPRTLPSLHRFLDLNVGSRRWRMLVTPAAAFGAGSDRVLPWMVGGAGGLLSLLLAGLILAFARSRSMALGLAAHMTVDLREREADLERVNRSLEAANKAMRDFVAIASHDMRSPLAAVIGFAHALHENWALMTEEERRGGIEVVERRAQQLARLVDDLLAVSEIDAEAVSVHHDVIDVAVAVRQAVEGHDGVVVRAPERLEAAVDRSHLTRMVANLVENAQKYGAPPVEVEAWEDGEWIELVVRDAGPGVPAEFVSRLFEKFARASGASATLEGTGLGLAIVRGLARANGGEAWYEARSPSGACFGVRLPRASASLDRLS